MDYSIIFHRRHPLYMKREAAWRHCRDAFSGGCDYIASTLIRHVSEVESEYRERQQRAYYLNYPRLIARRITQFVFSGEPVRRGADPLLVEDWSRSGMRTGTVMRSLSTMLNVFGRAALLVEAPNFSGEPTLNDARARRLRPYVRAVSPLDIPDWSYGDDGQLLWAIVRDSWCYDNRDPWKDGVSREVYRLYERKRWTLFTRGPEGMKMVSRGENPAGEVPLVVASEPDASGLEAPHWFEDAVRISEAILNNESEAQMNTVKQMFGLLVVSEAFARGARKQAARQNSGFSAMLARSAAVIESVEEKGISRYISPSGTENAAILEANRHLKEELFEAVGLSMRETAARRDASAESKAWDFHNISQFLSERAGLLEECEQRAWRLMNRFDPGVTVPEVVYNRKFAVRELAESIAGLLRLSQISDGREFRRAVGRAALELLDAIHPVTDEDKRKINAEINNENSCRS